MRRGLIVGINHYNNTPLEGCINDANKIYNLIKNNEDGTPNFDCKKIISSETKIDKASLQEAIESGLFTSLVCDALNGGAADLLGTVSTASVYAHVEPIFGAWEQRPLFKAHMSKSTVLRRCRPKLDPEILRTLPILFSSPIAMLKLDKSFEPTEEPKGHSNEMVFALLQKCRVQGLIRVDGEEHLYYAAMNEKSCSLTSFGQFYWHLAKNNKI
jgi:hypothetical protein